MSTTAAVSLRVHAWTYLVWGILVTAAGVTPVVGTGAWLILTDPGLVADVAARGDLLPLVWTIVDTLTTALRALLAYL